MLNTGLLTRPFSADRPRIAGYEPTISCRITRVGRGRTAWRAEILVDGTAMCTSHHATKTDAESHTVGMMQAYAEAHYFQV